MKVYLLWNSCPYEYGLTELEGVFSTREKAEEHMEEIISEFDYDEQDLSIEEREVK